jgi:hypothetical protein
MKETIVINGQKYEVISITYDRTKSMVEYLKRCDINLNYGASNNLPISIDCPKGFDLSKLEMLGIDYKNIPRDKLFSY